MRLIFQRLEKNGFDCFYFLALALILNAKTKTIMERKMAKTCLKCGHERQETATTCPQCGVIYAKAEAALLAENNRLYEEELRREKKQINLEFLQKLGQWLSPVFVALRKHPIMALLIFTYGLMLLVPRDNTYYPPPQPQISIDESLAQGYEKAKAENNKIVMCAEAHRLRNYYFKRGNSEKTRRKFAFWSQTRAVACEGLKTWPQGWD